jgi:Protein of unknown function (DUF559)
MGGGKQLGGHRFRRQQVIGGFIVDFYCPAAGLVVEVVRNLQGVLSRIMRALLTDGGSGAQS